MRRRHKSLYKRPKLGRVGRTICKRSRMVRMVRMVRSSRLDFAAVHHSSRSKPPDIVDVVLLGPITRTTTIFFISSNTHHPMDTTHSVVRTEGPTALVT